MPTDRDSIASVRPISKPLSACSTVSYTPSSTGHRAQALPPQHKIGLLIEDTEQPLAQLGLNLEPADALDRLNAASIRYRIAVGRGAGGRTLTLKNPALTRTDSTPKPFTANQDSFSLNCAVSCQPHQRDRLERLCRYITRPALCLDRLSVNASGQVVYQLKNPFRDGTTHVLFSPADFIARLAALVPRPRAKSHPLSRCIRSRLTAQATHRSSRGQTPQAQDQNNTGSSDN